MSAPDSEQLEKISERLVEFAIDREDIKLIVNGLPEDQDINKAVVDYEIQILKIISVGWSISIHMADHPLKEQVAETFWHKLNTFSHTLSETASLTTGQTIDYFQILKDRFDEYLGNLQNSKLKSDPASAVGPTFAELCRHKDNPFVVISGARIFNLSINSIREYLQTEGLLSFS